ncbi:hypothetical protein GCM10007063_34640 [Lentibacillus kapialis]|uniref:Uncharacterized protein n=1 Tax=Lentibacillus kapialis TaxID=340214 RepID=A0A917V1M2_9BACI|nr:hypothetical protein [Lentibacillus kapialis]GGK09256.1 hypothetical protein GCM10007063_34640 [Lentibacillus kapialis]
MSTSIVIIAIVSIVIWILVSQELIKPSKENKEKRKLITLMSAGSLSTLILTVFLFENIQL